MDWPKARAILLAAFTVVNLILAYSVWGSTALFPYPTDTPQGQTLEQFRETLLNWKLTLAPSVLLPRTPDPMRFVRVEFQPTPDLMKWSAELSGIAPINSGRDDMAVAESLRPHVDPRTQAMEYFPLALGPAAREVKLADNRDVVSLAEEYLRLMSLFPPGARFSGITESKEKGTVTVEYVPYFDNRPVYSGYVRVDISTRGVEKVTRFWVVPRAYTEAPAKQVRPASEALLRLAGRLASTQLRTVTDIQLGYYAGRPLSPAQSDDVHGWDTVPVWRITLDGKELYYINAFNGEWES
ncbi:MAG TPA: hypothetical protein VNT26_01060 [Candidatus Sulfotelmatobacter sp.]|nr:hypothetical protein [Candidatus Sulfotelmatobacter sp.]